MPAGSIDTSWTVYMDTRIFYAKNIRYEHRCQVLLKRCRKYHPVPNHEGEPFFSHKQDMAASHFLVLIFTGYLVFVGNANFSS